MRRQYKTQSITLVILLFLLTFLGVNCDTPLDTSQSQEQSHPSIGVEGPPDGIYTSYLSERDVETTLSSWRDASSVVGNWYINIKKNHFSLYFNNSFITEGSIVFDNNHAVMSIEPVGEEDCHSSEERTGSYKWAFDGKSLTFNLINDLCEGRRYVSTLRPWLLYPSDHPLPPPMDPRIDSQTDPT